MGSRWFDFARSGAVPASLAKIIMSLAVLALLPAGTKAGAAELRVFVTNEKSNNVTVIEALSGKVLATVAVGQRPPRCR